MPTDTEREELDSVDTKTKGANDLAEEAMKRCVQIVANVNRFKQPRLQRIKLYRDLYAGKVKPKYRQPFNVVLPTFCGAMDTLMAAFNDDLAMEYNEQEPADYFAAEKYQALWDMESTSTTPNAKFPLKTRQDRSNALFSGRGFMENFAVSVPGYQNRFDIFELDDAIFQPMGGGHLENHLYAGRDDLVRSASQLKSGEYDRDQVAQLLKHAAQTDFYPLDNQDGKDALAKYKAMGLNVQNTDYVGEHLFKLVSMVVTMNGERYYIAFSPWYKTWVRFCKLSEISSAGLYPWVSWATHEDNKNFLSKAYSDDLYGVADSVHTLFNQELTNREKRNFNARAYDRDMFPDVAKLDAAQSRPDALVPVDTKAGSRRIEEGIYTFATAELQGTVNLIDWMQQITGTAIGVTDLSMGGEQNVSKKATVAFTEQQNISKRLLLRSSSYTEAMAEVGKRFMLGCKDHLPAKKAIRALGADGEGWDKITRADLDTYSDIDVKIVSSSIEMQNSQLKKEARMKTLEQIGADQVLAGQINPTWRAEQMLRSGGEYDDPEIKVALDTKNYGNKEEAARAHEAIQAVLNNEKPQTFYGATTMFMQIIHDFAADNRNDLGDRKYHILLDFEQAHAQLAEENMMRAAQQAGSALAQPSAETPPTAPAQPLAPPTATPSPASAMRQVAAQMP